MTLTQLLAASSAALMLLSGSGCMSNGSTTAQSHDDAWCGAHPKSVR